MQSAQSASEIEPEKLVRQTIELNPDAKGLAIVVASQKSTVFSQPEDMLFGVVVDFNKICSVFRDLEYAVIRLLNCPKKTIVDVIKAVPKHFLIYSGNDLRYKRIVFCFAGHGDENIYIHTADGKIDVNSEIMWPLLPDECPNLGHIPKLFFIDACRGTRVDEAVPRGGGDDYVFSRVSRMANYLIVRSTLSYHQAFEKPGRQGGYWTQSFVEELKKPSNQGKDIGYILIEVNRQVNRLFNIPMKGFLQQAVTENTLLDHIFFIDEARELVDYKQRMYPWSGDAMHLPGEQYQQLAGIQSGTSSQFFIERGPISSSMASNSSSPVVTSYPTPPTQMICGETAISSQNSVTELERLLEERHGRGVKIEYKSKESSKGFQVTVFAPGLGHMDGEVCNTESKAQESAASKALNELSQDPA